MVPLNDGCGAHFVAPAPTFRSVVKRTSIPLFLVTCVHVRHRHGYGATPMSELAYAMLTDAARAFPGRSKINSIRGFGRKVSQRVFLCNCRVINTVLDPGLNKRIHFPAISCAADVLAYVLSGSGRRESLCAASSAFNLKALRSFVI